MRTSLERHEENGISSFFIRFSGYFLYFGLIVGGIPQPCGRYHHVELLEQR